MKKQNIDIGYRRGIIVGFLRLSLRIESVRALIIKTGNGFMFDHFC
ncbi:MAG: hypothetical protein ACTSR4_06225 [Candidatus Hodarchaeales archaeon]